MCIWKLIIQQLIKSFSIILWLTWKSHITFKFSLWSKHNWFIKRSSFPNKQIYHYSLNLSESWILKYYTPFESFVTPRISIAFDPAYTRQLDMRSGDNKNWYLTWPEIHQEKKWSFSFTIAMSKESQFVVILTDNAW